MLRVVIDTNVLISAVGVNSPYRLIFDKMKNREIEIAISNDILNEYREIIAQKMNHSIADNLTNYFKFTPNFIKVNIYYNWSLMQNDPDDNKFVDCAISGNVDFIVTNDKHFDTLNQIDFPKVKIVNSEDFMDMLSLL